MNTPRVDDAQLAKIRALLAKAESTTFDEEAEALTAKAQQLMTKHRIDQAMVRQGAPTSTEVTQRRVVIPAPYVRPKYTLLAAVAGENGVRAVLEVDTDTAVVFGTATDVAVVEELFTSLLVQATTAMQRAGRVVDGHGRNRTKRFRRAFLLAYAHRIGERLADAAEVAMAEAVAAVGDEFLPVLSRQDELVEAAVAETYPHLRHLRPSPVDPTGWYAGRTEADRADLAVGARLRGAT